MDHRGRSPSNLRQSCRQGHRRAVRRPVGGRTSLYRLRSRRRQGIPLTACTAAPTDERNTSRVRNTMTVARPDLDPELVQLLEQMPEMPPLNGQTLEQIRPFARPPVEPLLEGRAVRRSELTI